MELRVEMASIEGLLDSQHVLGYYGDNEEMGRDIIKHIQGEWGVVASVSQRIRHIFFANRDFTEDIFASG